VALSPVHFKLSAIREPKNGSAADLVSGEQRGFESAWFWARSLPSLVLVAMMMAPVAGDDVWFLRQNPIKDAVIILLRGPDWCGAQNFTDYCQCYCQIW
jgi:hypothetical protein